MIELDDLRNLFLQHYEYPYLLWALLILPVLMMRSILWPRRHATLRISSLASLRQSPDEPYIRGFKARLVSIPYLCQLLAVAMLIIALARPQTHDPRQIEVEGIDIYLVLDMSGSMQAVDLNLSEVNNLLRRGDYPKDRFSIAIDVLDDFVRSRHQRCSSETQDIARCDRIGMVVFGKDAFLEFPLTLDYTTILTLLSQRSLGDVDGSGTAIGNALGRAVAGLRHSSAKSKVIILITDGDRRGGDLSPAQASAMATHFDIHTYPILVGREGPTLLPKGSSFDHIEFPVNPALLQEIARRTGGAFYRASDEQTLERELHAILDRYELSMQEGTIDHRAREHYEPYAMGAFSLLFLSGILNFVILRRYQ